MRRPKPFLIKRIPAYTLNEVLIVLVIIGVLVLLTLPNLSSTVTKAKMVEAKQQLAHVHMLEKSYYYEHSKYSTDLAEIGFIQEKLSTDGKDGHANYRLEISIASTSGFTARAVAVTDFDSDGTFNVWEIDQDKNLKQVTPD